MDLDVIGSMRSLKPAEEDGELMTIPSPDEKSHSHGEQHDEGSHRHDDDDHRWVLFAGRQGHWNQQNQSEPHKTLELHTVSSPNLTVFFQLFVSPQNKYK
ncbi:hypothetical protein CHARACLAT_002032 [Characodon lateralis]|uniref:Uncharacterized protein n=1 Tax=Characodon lateralis TaxID=208331 RepID=A0ABU7D3W4_9TELE|nr:hypothetical protein [Characodon lateralis]